MQFNEIQLGDHVVSNVNKGVQYQVVGKANGWLRVRCETAGYTDLEFATRANILEPAPKAQHIKGAALTFPHLWTFFGMSKDKGGRWEPTASAPEYVHEYLRGIRSPSRAWPLSYAKALLTQKFAKLVCEQDPALAIKLGIGEEV